MMILYDYLLRLLIFLEIISGENGRIQTASRRRVRRRHCLFNCSPIWSNSNSLIHNISHFHQSSSLTSSFVYGNVLSCPEKSRWIDHDQKRDQKFTRKRLSRNSIDLDRWRETDSETGLTDKNPPGWNFYVIAALNRYDSTKPECRSTVWRQNDNFHKLLLREIRSSERNLICYILEFSLLYV